MLEPVALAVQFQNMDMVREAIEKRASETLAAEDGRPFLKGKSRGDDGRAAFVTLAEYLRRPLHGHRTEAGAGRRRFAKPRLGYTRAADLAEARHAARAGVARGHPYGPHPCRRDRVARPALPFPLPGRAKDHGRSLVRPTILWPQAAVAGLYFNRENRPWPGSCASRAHRPLRAKVRRAGKDSNGCLCYHKRKRLMRKITLRSMNIRNALQMI
jgi:hypothetical protein